jgi:SAM-dependent methyltransferase
MARGKRSLDSDWDRLFDELYLKTYAVRREEEAEALAIGAMRLADCEPGADVLDAACGYGRHSRVLAQAGYRTVGLDRSSVLLDEAHRRSEGSDWPRWVQGDYRELPFEAGPSMPSSTSSRPSGSFQRTTTFRRSPSSGESSGRGGRSSWKRCTVTD